MIVRMVVIAIIISSAVVTAAEAAEKEKKGRNGRGKYLVGVERPWSWCDGGGWMVVDGGSEEDG